MDVRYKRLGKNTTIVFLGNAGSRIISFLMLPFYTHYLSKAEYGTSDLINTYSSVFLAIVSCCVADAIFIFPKDKSDNEKKQYFSSGLFFLFLSLFFVCFIGLVLKKCIDNAFVQTYIWWVIAMTYSLILSNYIQQFTRSIDKMIIYSLTGLTYVISVAVLSFVLLPYYKLDGYLFALVLASVISSIFAFICSKSYKYLGFKGFNYGSLKELLKYGIPLIPNSIMWWLVDGLNRPVMVSELGADAIGIYAVANKIPGILTILFTIFSNAWGISMLEEFGKPDFNMFFNKTMRFLFFVVSLGTMFLIACSKLIVGVFAAADFYEAWMYVPVLTIGVVLQNLSSMIGGVFAAEKKSKYFFYSSFWGALCSVVLTLFLVKAFGLMGACAAIACSFLIMALARLKYAWKHINLFSIKFYAAIMFCIMAFTIVFVESHNTLITIFVFFVSCLSIIIIGHVEAKSMMTVVRQIIKRN